MEYKPDEIFTCLDLEMNQPSGTIIQIGAVVGNITTGEILERLSIYVHTDEILREDIVKLTKIHQEDVDNGIELIDAYRELKRMHKNHHAFVNPVTWGGGDSLELLQQLQAKYPGFDGWPFGRRWIDVKTLFLGWRIANRKPLQGGLARSMAKVNVQFNGHAHDARWDAENTFHMFRKMLEIVKGYEHKAD